ncbi:MAG: hypothetical protein FJY83_09715, partial [Candidatus Aminicenantes bacterium]|nr:hypothetical protein [Candidatus Aminicenantes bacterium]
MKQQNVLVSIVVAALVLGAFFLLYYRPKAVQLSALKEQRRTLEAEVSKLRQKKREMDKIELQLKSLETELQGLEAIIPEKR